MIEPLLLGLGALALAACTLWIFAGLWAVAYSTRLSSNEQVLSSKRPLPPVTILKPLCGADAGLEANLRSFFEQDHPELELVFGVESCSDPAIEIVERMRARYAHVPCHLVVHGGLSGHNPKVRNLRGMLPHASHDLLLISDSNVRVPPHYAREMVRGMIHDEDVGLVTSIFAGTGEQSLGAALDNVQLNGFIAAGVTLPTLFGDVLVVGKSVLLSRRIFERLGGFDRLANVLAEDYVMGKMVQHAGLRVRVSPSVLANVTSHVTIRGFLARHLRWSMLRARLRPLGYAAEPIASPLFLAPVALALLGGVGVLWVIAMILVRAVGGWLLLRGRRGVFWPVLLGPVRELLMIGVWLWAPLKRHVSWRGHRVRVGAGTMLFSDLGQ